MRGEYLANISLCVPSALFEGDVIDSRKYDASRFGLCGVSYCDMKSNRQYQAQYQYDMNSASVDDFFNPSNVPIMLPNDSASFRITCDFMSEDGNTFAGQFSAVVIRDTDGAQVTLENGRYKFTASPSQVNPSTSLPQDSGSTAQQKKMCFTCHGTGQCSLCNGTGTYHNYGFSSDCSCDNGDCPICGGDGFY